MENPDRPHVQQALFDGMQPEFRQGPPPRRCISFYATHEATVLRARGRGAKAADVTTGAGASNEPGRIRTSGAAAT